MTRVVFTRAARLDVVTAYRWYEHQRPGLGRRLTAEIRTALDRIREGPARPPAIFDVVRRVSLRRFPYQVFYFRRADQVVVLAVFHVRRRPLEWRRKI